jgi:hypothetical protein
MECPSPSPRPPADRAALGVVAPPDVDTLETGDSGGTEMALLALGGHEEGRGQLGRAPYAQSRPGAKERVRKLYKTTGPRVPKTGIRIASPPCQATRRAE